jgi:hypothetical protein
MIVLTGGLPGYVLTTKKFSGASSGNITPVIAYYLLDLMYRVVMWRLRDVNFSAKFRSVFSVFVCMISVNSDRAVQLPDCPICRQEPDSTYAPPEKERSVSGRAMQARGQTSH